MALAVALHGCGTDEIDRAEAGASTDASLATDSTGTNANDGSSATSQESGADTASSQDHGSSSDADTGDSDDTSGTVAGPIELYRGPVAGGAVPGWDPENPRPLLMMGRQGTDWIATLAQIGPDGSLSQNAAEEIVVWGWASAPMPLYDGPVGGTLPSWSADTPHPVVMLGRSPAQDAWWSTLATIGPDGELGDNVADRIIVWGWPMPGPGSPVPVYAGPLDEGAIVPDWNPDDPEPLVMLGRLADADTWHATLARIGPDGTLSDNAAEELHVWGW